MTDAQDPGDARAPGLRRWGRRVAMGVGLGAAGLVALLTGLVVALQFDGVSTSVARRVAAAVSNDSLRVEVGRVGGSWLSGLTLTDVRVAATSGGEPSWSLAADSLSVDYRLLPLLRRSVELSGVRGAGVEGAARLAAAADTVPRDTARASAGAWRVRVDVLDLDVREVALTVPGVAGADTLRGTPESAAARTTMADPRDAGRAAPASDPTLSPDPWTLTDARLRARDIVLGDVVAGVLDTLAGAFRPPGRPAGWGRLHVGGALDGGRVRVDEFALTSPESDVRIHGTVPVALEGVAPQGLDLELALSPLHLADVGPFLPAGISDSIRVDVQGHARTTADTLDVRLRATSSVGGRVEIDAGVRGSREEPVVRGRVEVVDVDLSAWGLTPRSLVVDGSADVDVTGRSVDGLRGSASADVRVADSAGGLRGRGEFVAQADPAGGPWRVRWDGQGLGASSDGTATLDPTGRVAWTLDGTVRWAEPGRPDGTVLSSADTASSAAFLPVRLAGAVTASGRGIRPDSLDGRAEIRLDSLTLAGGAEVGSGRLVAELREGQVRVTVDAAVAGGRIEAEGRGDLTARTAVVERGRIEDVDVAALLGDTVPSRLSADVRGRLEGLEPLEATGSATVAGARYAAWSVDSVRATVDARGDEARFRVDALLADSGRVAMRGRWRGGTTPTADVDTLTWYHLDLRSLVGAGDASALPAADLSGRGSGRAQRGPEGWAGAATLRFDSSSVGAAVLAGGRVELTMEDGTAGVEADLHLGSGRLAGSAMARLGEGERRYEIPVLRFDSVDPGALTGDTTAATVLTGSLSGTLSGPALESLDGRVRVHLSASRVSGTSVDTVSVDARVRAGEVDLDGSARALGATLLVSGGGRPMAPRPTYRLEGSVDRPGAGTRQDPALFLRFGADGAGRESDSVDAEAWVEVDSAAWAGRAVEAGRARASLRDGLLRVDTVDVRLPGAEILGGGSLPLAADAGGSGELRLAAALRRADLLEGLAGGAVLALGEAGVELTVTGAADDFAVEGEARLSALLYDRVRVQGMELEGRGRRTSADGWIEAGAHLVVDRIRLPTAPVQSVEVEATLDEADEVAVVASAVIDGRRDARLTARVEWVPRPSTGVLEEFSFRADEDRWSLVGPARVSLRDGFEVDSLELRAGDQRFDLRGRVGSQGPLDLHAEVVGFEMATVADLLGYPALRGPVGLTADLSGTGEAPVLRSRLDGRVEPADAPAADVAFTVDYADGAAELDGTVSLDRGALLSASGTLPVRMSGRDEAGAGLTGRGSLSLTATTDSFPLAFFDAFLPASSARDLDGVLDASVEVDGQPDDPRFRGRLSVADATVRLPELGVTYQDGHAELALDGQQIRIDSLRLASGDGRMSASGTVTLERLDEPRYDVTVRAERFAAIRSSEVHATVSGQVDVRGRGLAPTLAGRVDVERADLYLADLMSTPDVEGVSLTEEDYEELARVFGYRRPAERMEGSSFMETATLDLDVRLGRASWVRQRSNPELALQFAGEMSVQKEPGDSIRLVGSVEAVPERSFVEQFGRRFSIEEGRLTFRGPPSATQVEVRAEYDVPSRENPGDAEVVLALDVTGTPGNLSLELSSTPPLEASDMVAYLVTGRPATQTLGGGGDDGSSGGIASTGGALALGRLSGAVEAYAREQVGLDVVEITTDGLEGVTLLAGRYLSPDLYLGVRQPVSLQRSSDDGSQRTPSPELEVELQAVRWLLLNLRAGGRIGVEFYVRSRIAYE